MNEKRKFFINYWLDKCESAFVALYAIATGETWVKLIAGKAAVTIPEGSMVVLSTVLLIASFGLVSYIKGKNL